MSLVAFGLWWQIRGRAGAGTDTFIAGRGLSVPFTPGSLLLVGCATDWPQRLSLRRQPEQHGLSGDRSSDQCTHLYTLLAYASIQSLTGNRANALSREEPLLWLSGGRHQALKVTSIATHTPELLPEIAVFETGFKLPMDMS